MDMKYFLYLSGMINEDQLHAEEVIAEGKGDGPKNYMFFSNLRQIKDMCEKILAKSEKEVDGLLDDGHAWAVDHIATSKDDVEEVYNWLMHRDNKEGKGKA